MKITNQLNVQSVLNRYNKNVKKTESSEQLGLASDTVEISDQARAIQVAKKALSEIPDVRSEKVESVKSALQSGQYKPSAEEVVNKLLSGLNLTEE
ncbi:MAG: negative regulator of flagellin synthesis FlgM [Clostridiales bacterium]|nr:negative regulator of flagellin synthesis FlgM [Clostridiales bacterium]